MSDELRFRLHLRREDFRLQIDEALPGRGITGVYGASGAGKTTMLRCIAGLERPSDALVRVRDTVWQDSSSGLFVPVHQRRLAYVFQEPRLFPHLSVARNLNYAARRSRASAVTLDRVVELLTLESLLPRAVAGLSGGEAKRVAIARALLRSPDLLLMDEPLASLDARRRHALMPYLQRLQSELTMPMVYVSHSIDEITQLCDHLLVLEDGRVAASGPLQEVLMRSDIESLAGAEAGVVIETEKTHDDEVHQLTRLRFSGGELWVASPVDSLRPRVRIRANDVSLCRHRPLHTSILNVVAAKIEDVEQDSPASVLVRLLCGSDRLLARITRRSFSEMGLARGDEIFAQVKSIAVRYRID